LSASLDKAFSFLAETPMQNLPEPPNEGHGFYLLKKKSDLSQIVTRLDCCGKVVDSCVTQIISKKLLRMAALIKR